MSIISRRQRGAKSIIDQVFNCIVVTREAESEVGEIRDLECLRRGPKLIRQIIWIAESTDRAMEAMASAVSPSEEKASTDT